MQENDMTSTTGVWKTPESRGASYTHAREWYDKHNRCVEDA